MGALPTLHRQSRRSHALRQNVATLLTAWIDDLNNRVVQGVPHARAPMVFGPPLLFAVAESLDELEHRVLLAQRGEWHALTQRVRSHFASPTAQEGRARRRERTGRSRLSRAERCVQKAEACMNRGLVSKAVRSLKDVESHPHAPPSDVSALLRRLFVVLPSPPAPPSPRAEVCSRPFAKSAVRRALEAKGNGRPWSELVLRGLCALGRGSSAGPCGLRRDILLVLTKHSDRLVDSLAGLVDHALAGRLRGGYLSGSLLALLPKPDGGLRPIGMGSILRRLAGKLAVRSLTPLVRAFNEDRDQLALSEAGTSRVFRRVAHAAAHGDVVVGLDISNAFNTVHRDVILATIAEHAGPAKALCRTLYDEPSSVLAPLPRRESTDEEQWDDHEFLLVDALGDRSFLQFHTGEGVVQGCPLAPVLFATTMASALAPVRARHPQVAFHAFHDDVFLTCNSTDALVDAFTDVKMTLAQIGLHLSATKCKTLMPRPDTIPAALRDCAMEVPVLKCMGGFIAGCDDDARVATLDAAWMTTVKEVDSTVRSFRHLRHPQHILTALQQAGAWSRVQYHASLDDTAGLPMAMLPLLEEADAAMLAVALRHCGPRLNPIDWLRATLPVAMGGLGIKSVTAQAQARRPVFMPYLHCLEEGGVGITDMRHDLVHATSSADATMRDLIFSVLPPERAIRFAELGGKYATDWLTVTATPCDDTLIQRPSVAAVCIALACGAAVLPEDVQRCPGAGRGCTGRGYDPMQVTSVLDRFGHHAATCPHRVTPRHNMGRNALARMWTQGTRDVADIRKEVGVNPGGSPAQVDTGPRPGDIAYLPTPTSTWTYIDYTVAAPAGSCVVRDPCASAALARRRKGPRPNTDDAHYAIIAQGSMGGLDPESETAIQAFASATAILRDDHFTVAAVLRARLQIACLFSQAELVVTASKDLGAAPALSRPLSGPPTPMCAEDQAVIHSLIVLMRAHSDLAVSARWLGDWKAYLPDVASTQQPRQYRHDAHSLLGSLHHHQTAAAPTMAPPPATRAVPAAPQRPRDAPPPASRDGARFPVATPPIPRSNSPRPRRVLVRRELPHPSFTSPVPPSPPPSPMLLHLDQPDAMVAAQQNPIPRAISQPQSPSLPHVAPQHPVARAPIQRRGMGPRNRKPAGSHLITAALLWDAIRHARSEDLGDHPLAPMLHHANDVLTAATTAVTPAMWTSMRGVAVAALRQYLHNRRQSPPLTLAMLADHAVGRRMTIDVARDLLRLRSALWKPFGFPNFPAFASFLDATLDADRAPTVRDAWQSLATFELARPRRADRARCAPLPSRLHPSPSVHADAASVDVSSTASGHSSALSSCSSQLTIRPIPIVEMGVRAGVKAALMHAPTPVTLRDSSRSPVAPVSDPLRGTHRKADWRWATGSSVLSARSRSPTITPTTRCRPPFDAPFCLPGPAGARPTPALDVPRTSSRNVLLRRLTRSCLGGAKSTNSQTEGKQEENPQTTTRQTTQEDIPTGKQERSIPRMRCSEPNDT